MSDQLINNQHSILLLHTRSNSYSVFKECITEIVLLDLQDEQVKNNSIFSIIGIGYSEYCLTKKLVIHEVYRCMTPFHYRDSTPQEKKKKKSQSKYQLLSQLITINEVHHFLRSISSIL